MRLTAIFLILIPVILLAGIISCKPEPKEYSSLDDFTGDLLILDTNDLDKLRVYHYSLITKSDHDRIWATLADTNCPISKTIEEVNKCKSIPKYFQKSLHAFLNHVALGEYLHTYEKPLNQKDSLLREKKLGYAIRKIVIKLDSLYEQNIIYDVYTDGATFGSNYVFLENHEVHIVNSIFFSMYEIHPWRMEGDTIIFPQNDSTDYRMIEEEKHLRPVDNDSYWLKLRRPSKSHLLKKP